MLFLVTFSTYYYYILVTMAETRGRSLYNLSSEQLESSRELEGLESSENGGALRPVSPGYLLPNPCCSLDPYFHKVPSRWTTSRVALVFAKHFDKEKGADFGIFLLQQWHSKAPPPPFSKKKSGTGESEEPQNNVERGVEGCWTRGGTANISSLGCMQEKLQIVPIDSSATPCQNYPNLWLNFRSRIN